MSIKKNKGFTLIELLVVIAIISLLSSIVLASLNSARMKARDAKQIKELKNVSLAMELYFDKYGKYPLTPNTGATVGDGGTHDLDFQSMVGTLVNEGFLSSKPKSPTSGKPYMHYNYGTGNSVGEIIVAELEGISPTTVGPFNSCRPFGINWCSSTLVSTYYCLCHPY